MDINFTYLSLLAMVVSGGIWLYDIYFLRSAERGVVPEYVAYAKSIFPLAVIAFLVFWLQDLPLLLLIAVAYTGFVWLIDVLFFRKRRAQDAPEPANVEYSRSFFPVLLIVFVIRSFVIEPFQIPSESMVPTLEVGDFIVVNKFTYGIRLPVIRTKVIGINEPKRGDVMVFFPPKEDRYFIKRVIGLPGDKISYNNKVLSVNGEVFEQTFVGYDTSHDKDRCEEQLKARNVVVIENINGVEHETRYCSDMRFTNSQFDVVVPAGHYFMMGDNRDNSQDSRVWGFVPEDRIVGKAFARWMYWKDKLTSLPSFSRVGAL